MKEPELVKTTIVYRIKEMAKTLIGRYLDELTETENRAAHLCFCLQLLIPYHGPEGESRGVIMDYEDWEKNDIATAHRED